MKALLLLTALLAGVVSSHSVSSTEPVALNNPGPKDKGFIEWVSNLLGGGSSTAKPVTEEPIVPPSDCPVCKCGVARTRRRIIGGTETAVLEFPWMAALKYSGRFYCGAASLTIYTFLPLPLFFWLPEGKVDSALLGARPVDGQRNYSYREAGRQDHPAPGVQRIQLRQRYCHHEAELPGGYHNWVEAPAGWQRGGG
ncbi:hypothetical protein ACJJTC_014756 [Scirpophaga incertulas]